MPLYEYVSDTDSDITRTVICKYEDRPDSFIEDGHTFRIVKIAGIYRPVTDSSYWGINGFYDKHLNARYNSYKERDAICDEKGVAPVSSSEIDTAKSKAQSAYDKTTKQIEAHKKAQEAQKKGESYLKAFETHNK